MSHAQDDRLTDRATEWQRGSQLRTLAPCKHSRITRLSIFGDPSITLPEFNRAILCKLPRPFFGLSLIFANKVNAVSYAAIRPEKIGRVPFHRSFYPLAPLTAMLRGS